MPSQDGKGRTIFDILTGRNQRDITPLEAQYHNPLNAKIGNTISFDHEPEISGINFIIDKISVYETRIKSRKFYHTDYHLRGISLEMEKPIRIRLRLIPDEDENNKLAHKIVMLTLYDEMGWDEDFYNNVLCDEAKVIEINQDDLGNDLETPRTYWRIADVFDPYNARVTVLSDQDGDGKVEESELERYDVTYWDYSRLTDNDAGQEIVEFLTVEMDTNKYFSFLRGTEIAAFQVTVI